MENPIVQKRLNRFYVIVAICFVLSLTHVPWKSVWYSTDYFTKQMEPHANIYYRSILNPPNGSNEVGIYVPGLLTQWGAMALVGGIIFFAIKKW